MFFQQKYYLNTNGKQEVMLASSDVKRALSDSKVKQGILNVALSTGSAGLALLENDPKILDGVKKYLIEAFAEDPKAASEGSRRSGAGAAYQHQRAALLQATLSLPIKDGQLATNPWQEVFVFEFEAKPHRRELIITILGE